MSTLFLIFLGIFPGDAPDPPRIEPADPPRIVNRVKELRKVTHSHRCTRCGFEWWHDDLSFGIVADHICPKCGSGPYWSKYRSRK